MVIAYPAVFSHFKVYSNALKIKVCAKDQQLFVEPPYYTGTNPTSQLKTTERGAYLTVRKQVIVDKYWYPKKLNWQTTILYDPYAQKRVNDATLISFCMKKCKKYLTVQKLSLWKNYNIYFRTVARKSSIGGFTLFQGSWTFVQGAWTQKLYLFIVFHISIWET